MTLPQTLALVAALFYAGGALMVKRASDLGAGVWVSAFVANMVTVTLFLPLLALGGTWHPELWWQPALIAVCFVCGQCLTFVSIGSGDVSVATPVLGIKLLLVAPLVALLGGDAVTPRLWAAAGLATAGIALLNRRGAATRHHRVGFTIATAGLAAASFALFDVLVQMWAPRWGLGRLLPLTMGLGGLLSLGFITQFETAPWRLPRAVWPWLLGGTLMIAGQSVVFVSTIARWGHAAPVNVIYSSRGLWTVLLVWVCGRWLQSRESAMGGKVLGWRLAGAALMMSAVVLVLT